MKNTPILALLDFKKLFIIECDAIHVGIGAFLSQEEKLMKFFSEKLTNSWRQYFTYDFEFYTFIRVIHHWQHYLAYNKFIVYSDHQALRY